ncbi:unnamed protein product [Auanema sp. JU1783]|nr:unnamed protein product [Auanema sp. JU1783]
MLPSVRRFLSIGKVSNFAKVAYSTHDYSNVDVLTPGFINHLKINKSSSYSEDDYDKKVLEPRRISDSRTKCIIPLSTDEEKQLLYTSTTGSVRVGKILEVLDLMSVYVSMLHNREIDPANPVMSLKGPSTLPRNIVTASLYKMDILQSNLSSNRDIILEGYVGWAGRSSLDVALFVYQNNGKDSTDELVMRANFMMASRHPRETRAVRIHPLIAETEEDEQIIKLGEQSALERKKDITRSLIRTYPTNEEFRLLHNNLLESVKKSEGHVYQPELREDQAWISDTKTEVQLICHPENQNVYGKIFGGFIMKEALELAQLNAEMFCKERVRIIAMDDVKFSSPVEIGDFLHITAFITNTKQHYMQVHAHAEVVCRKTYVKRTSNEFHFTMETVSEKPVREVFPRHYSHGTLWLDGHRHLEKALTRNSKSH